MKIDKKILRQQMIELRDSQLSEDKTMGDRAIFEKLTNSKFYKESKVIMIYVSMGSEADTISIIKHALGKNKIICVPKVINIKEGMRAIRIESLTELKSGKFGIMEPDGFEKQVSAGSVDLFLIPGLAFDKTGGRIGYGAGFYDRFLREARQEALKIGLAYDFQVIKEVPMDDYDVRLDSIIDNGCTQ